jgi:Zn-dependent protease
MDVIQKIAIWALPVLFAITVHEAAHGYAARALGDSTAWVLGRLTLNPLKHIDPVGTVILPLLLLTLGGFIFGWAKPVPVNSRNLRHPRRDMAIVAAAGPLANLVMALLWTASIWLGLTLLGVLDWVAIPLIYMGQAGILINVVLMVLNLLPIPPLDGGRVLSGLVPARVAAILDRIEPYGLFLILGLLVIDMSSNKINILLPPVLSIADALQKAAGL